MSSLRLLQVTQVYPPYHPAGGQAVKVQAIARQLGLRGHRVTVLTAEHGKIGVPRYLRDVHEVVYLPSALRHRTLTVNPASVAFCRRRLREFEVVHIYGVYDLLGPTVAAFCRRLNIPYVLEPLGMFRPIIRSLPWKRLYHGILGRRLVEGAARVIATSQIEREELVGEGVPDEKIVVRRNGVDLVEMDRLPARGTFRRELGLRDGEPLVLSMARLSRKKGLDVLLRAFALAGAPGVLALVGPDDGDGCVDEIALLRRRLGLGERVRLVGTRLGERRLEAYVDADVFVLPSRSENFGNAAAEAIACGVPVVVTDRCGIAPFVQDRAGLVVPCEERALAVALRRILQDRALHARCRSAALRMRTSLGWGRPIAEQERLYRELAS
jgi:glycosyltransferase involved in cell wall biosynthesis